MGLYIILFNVMSFNQIFSRFQNGLALQLCLYWLSYESPLMSMIISLSFEMTSIEQPDFADLGGNMKLQPLAVNHAPA